MTELGINAPYLTDLAKQQDRAAEEIESGTKAVEGAAEQLWYDYGPICGYTAQAMTDCESVRRNAGNTMKMVSAALAEDLRDAAAAYVATDQAARGVIDRQVVGG
ncbi:type VII secretion target [Mycobacterium genavense]|uniref:type VII secretion target n=1 Tax=Mycobacterium genavense TaxID=36812 RepID=UPI00046EFF7A|nr:type VII secretion target [Mycobacterium genavense]